MCLRLCLVLLWLTFGWLCWLLMISRLVGCCCYIDAFYAGLCVCGILVSAFLFGVGLFCYKVVNSVGLCVRLLVF